MPAAKAQVLVLGGGLAGCAAAIRLARSGRAVTLIEREAGPRHKVCGEFLSAEALHLLGRLGVEPAVYGAEPVHTVRLAACHTMVSSPLPFPARSLTRHCLDSVLLEAAEAAGVQVRRGASVEALARAGDGWRATLGGEEIREAPQVVLATGKHDLRGFARPPGVQGDLVAMKMYFRLDPAQAHELAGTVELLLHPFGYTGLEPVEDGRANLTALVRRKHLATLGGWTGLLDELRHTNAQAARRLAQAKPLLAKPLAISSIPYGFVRKEALGSQLYAVGDQAAVIPSFTGDGMSIALYSGLRVAKALLAGQTAEEFQQDLHRTLRWQVRRATGLSQALVHPVGKSFLLTGARLWPGGMRAAAAFTRLPVRALDGLR